MKAPCNVDAYTLPLPLHWAHVLGTALGLAPDPLHVSHAFRLVTAIRRFFLAYTSSSETETWTLLDDVLRGVGLRGGGRLADDLEEEKNEPKNGSVKSSKGNSPSLEK